MGALSYDQIATLAYNAGFRGADIPIAVAVAEAESGGDPKNSSTAGNSPPSTDRGLMQINSYWNRDVPDSVAYDPVKAMQASKQIVQTRGWRDWVTYTKGAYQQFMPAAQAAAAKVNAGHFTPIAGVNLNANSLPAQAPGTSKTTTSTTGGTTDWNALGIASLLADAGHGINMSGKFSPHDILGSMLAKAASGAYTTPTVVTNNTIKNAAQSASGLPASPSSQPGGSFAGTFPKDVSAAVKRHDMGRDAQGPAGTPLLANGSGHVASIGNNPGGFGIAYPVIHYDTGPWAGLDIYYGHTRAAVSAGQAVTPGMVITHTQDGSGPYVGNATGLPGWVEIGLASNFGKGYGGSNPGPLPPGL